MTDSSTTVGRYRFIAKLGEGGMARVFLTISQGPSGFNKLLVMKELREELADDPEFHAMFLAEARLAAQLNHPNVVQTYEIIEEAGRLLIAMEYLEGQPFHVVLGKIGRQNVPLNLQVHVLAQALAGLHYAHDLQDLDGTPLGLVHRDVSPQNIFVTYDGQVKVLDFGIAKCAGSVQRTRAGDFKGKVHYAAPEQILMQSLDRRADVFSVGVMLWEALTGQRLGAKGAEIGIAHARVNGQEPKVREVNPDAPTELADICDRAMATNATDRFESAAALQEALEKYLTKAIEPAGTRELGAMMSERFARQKANVRALIEKQVKASRSAAEATSESSSVPLVEGSSSDVSSDGNISTGATRSAVGALPSIERVDDASSGSIPLNTTREQISVQSIPPPRPSGLAPKTTWRWGLLAAPVTLAIVGAFASSRGGPPRPPLAAASTAVQQPVAVQSAAQPEVSSAPAATPAVSVAAPVSSNIQITLRAKPDNATLVLDGLTLGANPFKAAFAKDTGIHKLKVSAPGHVAIEKGISYQEDAVIEIELDKVGAPSRARARKRSQGSPNIGARGRQASSPHRREGPLLTMKRQLVVASVIGSMLATQLVVAQPSPPNGPTPSSSSSSPAPVSSANVEEGRAHHQRGVELSKQKNYRAALIEFQRAYAVAPNYRILFNLGQTSLELQDYAAAQQAFEQYLAEGGSEIPADKRSVAESSLQKLKQWIAHVSVIVNVDGSEILVDDVSVGTSPLSKPLLVSAGRRRISAVKSGAPPVFRALDVAGGDTLEVKLEIVDAVQTPKPIATVTATATATTPPPPPPKPNNNAMWYSLAATSGFALGALTTGLLAVRQRSLLDDRLNTFPSSQSSIDSARQGTKALAITTDVLGGAALIAGGFTLYFAFRTPPAQQGSASPSSSVATSSRPVLEGARVSGSGLSVFGSF
ncbi:MAG: serine/threonine-protein kinase [Polyangiaceae bacterium]